MQGQFTQVPGPSQPQGFYPPSTVFQMGQPSPPGPLYIVRAPTAPMTSMQQYQPPAFEPRAREKKIIQIKDPNSNKDVTQEILNRQPSGSMTSSTGGTPNNTTPDISGQNSSSSTPPLTSQQQAEANVRAQFAAQVAATLASNTEEKAKKPEVIIQKAPVNNRVGVDTVQTKESIDAQKNEAVKETKMNTIATTVTETELAEKPVEKAVEAQPKEAAVKTQPKEAAVKTQPKEAAVKTQPKEAMQGSKLSEGVSVDSALGSKSVVSSVDATTSAKEIISNVRVEIFTADEVRNKEAQQSSTAAVTDVIKTEKNVKPEDTAKQAASDVLPVPEAKTLNGPVSLPHEDNKETEEVITVESQAVVEAPPPPSPPLPPVTNVPEAAELSKVTEEEVLVDQVTEPEVTAKQAEEPDVLQTSEEVEDVVEIEKVNGHEEDVKTASATPKNPVDTQAAGLYTFDSLVRLSWSFLQSYSTDRRYPSNANAKHAQVFCVTAFSKHALEDAFL